MVLISKRQGSSEGHSAHLFLPLPQGLLSILLCLGFVLQEGCSPRAQGNRWCGWQ